MMETYKTVALFNFTDEDFTHTWDKEPYTIKAGARLFLPDWLAQHLAKHLIDRELNKKNLPTDFMCSNKNDERYEMSRDRLLAKCIVSEGALMQGSSLKQEVELLNRSVEEKAKQELEEIKKQGATSEVRFCDSCDSKGGRHKKECPKNQANETVEHKVSEFEGLKAITE